MVSYQPIKKPSFQPPQHSPTPKQQHYNVPPPQQKKGQSLKEMEISRKNAERLGEHIVNFSKSAPTPAIQSKSTTEELRDNNEQETEALETKVVKTSNTPSTPEIPNDSNNQENPVGINEGITSSETSIWLQRSQNLVLEQQQQKQALLAQRWEKYQRFQAAGSNLYSSETTSQLQSENLTGEEVSPENIELPQTSSTSSTPEQNGSGASIQTKCDACEAKEKEEASEVQTKLTVGQPGEVQPQSNPSQSQLENKLPVLVNNQIENKLGKLTAKLPQLENKLTKAENKIADASLKLGIKAKVIDQKETQSQKENKEQNKLDQPENQEADLAATPPLAEEETQQQPNQEATQALNPEAPQEAEGNSIAVDIQTPNLSQGDSGVSLVDMWQQQQEQSDNAGSDFTPSANPTKEPQAALEEVLQQAQQKLTSLPQPGTNLPTSESLSQPQVEQVEKTPTDTTATTEASAVTDSVAEVTSLEEKPTDVEAVAGSVEVPKAQEKPEETEVEAEVKVAEEALTKNSLSQQEVESGQVIQKSDDGENEANLIAKAKGILTSLRGDAQGKKGELQGDASGKKGQIDGFKQQQGSQIDSGKQAKGAEA